MAGLTAGGGVGVGMGVGMPLAVTLLGSGTLAVAFPLGTVAIAYIGAREVYRRVVERRRAVVGALFDRVVEEARRSIGAPAGELPQPATPSLPPTT
jgi:hypothetical protein